MDLILDEDVKAVAAFMQRHVACARLVAVADGVAALAPLLWGQYTPEPFETLRLQERPPTAVCSPHTESSASELA